MRNLILCLLGLIFAGQTLAVQQLDTVADSTHSKDDLVEQRLQLEKLEVTNPFVISFYKPNYILPFYYDFGTPYLPNNNTVATDNKIKNTEFKFQFSLKVPLWRDILGFPSTLYVAYTQSSLWQAYTDSPFFRETNYEPELILANNIDFDLGSDWRIKFANLGIVHQSNGRGGELERSWNRIYMEATLANTHWMVTVKPWLIMQDSSLRLYNPNLVDYLGHGQLMVVYKYKDNAFALLNRNSLDSQFKRGTVEFTWSYPLLNKVRGYVQVFSGYGQSLIDYERYTNAVGIGIALNDWI